MEKINPQELLCMNDYEDESNIRIELAYARDDNLLFGERIYREDARLWLHNDLARIVLESAKILKNQKLRLVLYDGLRTTTAQEKMLGTQAVKDNPQWLEEPRLLSPPGAGAHPRGMAIDCSLETLDGQLLDMGTAFDDLSPKAHREDADVSDRAKENRQILQNTMLSAAEDLNIELLALPQEWWDFRLPPEVYERFAPLSDEDLPQNMRMV